MMTERTFVMMTDYEGETRRLNYWYRVNKRAEFIGGIVLPVVKLLHRLGLLSQYRLNAWLDYRDHASYAREEYGQCLWQHERATA